jgi:formate/nitrite transporter FocA (FNT family)
MVIWAGEYLFGIVLSATAGWWQPAIHPDTLMLLLVGRTVLWNLCGHGFILLLIWAVVTDRRAVAPTGNESDYADTHDVR